MVWVAGGRAAVPLTGFQAYPPVDLGEDFFIDRYEVTNASFKQFVDAGGYEREEYWDVPFVKEGHTLSFSQAMEEFRDTTDRPGPATWELGNYAEGQDDHPVTGVSWYEADAYARFLGKRLPTIFHWARAASPLRRRPATRPPVHSAASAKVRSRHTRMTAHTTIWAPCLKPWSR